MTEIAYERYLIHTAEKDFVRANMDSWIVEYTSYGFHATASEGYKFPKDLRDLWFPLKGFAIDMCVIVGFSTLMTFFVAKKLLPRLELQ